MAQIKKMKSIREQVYDNLKDMILDGDLSPGEKIVELDYATQFGVSRTPIREALRMLENEGLVNMSEKGGVRVNYLKEDDIKEIYEIRIALENLVIKKIVEKEKNDFSEIEKLLQTTKEEMDKSSDINKLLKMFSDFNKLLYELSSLNHVLKLIKNINEYTRRFRRASISNTERCQIAYEEHVKLLEYLKKKDIKNAIKINEIHLKTSMDYSLKKYKEKK